MKKILAALVIGTLGLSSAATAQQADLPPTLQGTGLTAATVGGLAGAVVLIGIIASDDDDTTTTTTTQ